MDYLMGIGRRHDEPRADVDGLALPGRFRDEIRRRRRRIRRGGTGGVMDRMKALAGEGASRDDGGLGSGGGAAPAVAGRGWRMAVAIA